MKVRFICISLFISFQCLSSYCQTHPSGINGIVSSIDNFNNRIIAEAIPSFRQASADGPGTYTIIVEGSDMSGSVGNKKPSIKITK
jgi:hypothetical protein